MQCMLQNILKEVIFWALLASGDFHKNENQCPRKALLGDAWSEILVGLSELGLTVLSRLWNAARNFFVSSFSWESKILAFLARLARSVAE